jgi:transposase-like protein
VKAGEAGRKVADVCRANGMSEQTYYRWRTWSHGIQGIVAGEGDRHGESLR